MNSAFVGYKELCIIHILRKPNSIIANYMISRMLPGLRRDPPNAQQYFEIYVPVCKGNINIQVRQNGNGKIYYLLELFA